MAASHDRVLSAVRQLVQTGALDQAAQQLRRAIEEGPDEPRLWVRLGEVQEMAGRRVPATEAYQRAAQLFSERNSYLQAVAVYKRKLLPLAPEMLSAHVRLAELYHYLGLLDDALEQYLLVAKFYEQRQRRPEAVRILRRVLDLKPESIPARLRLAELCRADKQEDEAAEQFGRVCDLLLASRKHQDYLKVAERLVFLRPNDLRRTRELIGVLLEQGNPKRALHHLQRGLQMAPEDLELLELLARTFLDLGQTNKTVQVLEELTRLHDKRGNGTKVEELRRRVRDLTSGGSGVEAPGRRPPDPPPPAADVARPSPPAPPSRRPSGRPTGAAPPPAAPERAPASPRGAPAPAKQRPAGAYDPGAGDTRPMSREEFLADEAAKTNKRPAASERRSSGEQVERLLHETRVYVKYGLKHKALDHISRVLVHSPENIEALLIRKQLLLQSGEQDKAALVLLRLAEITRDDSAQSQAYVEEARRLGVGPLARPGTPAREPAAGAGPRGATLRRGGGVTPGSAPGTDPKDRRPGRGAEIPRRGRTLPPLSAAGGALQPGAPAVAVSDEQITTPLPRMSGAPEAGGAIPSDLLNVATGVGLIAATAPGDEASSGPGTEPEVPVPAQLAPDRPAAAPSRGSTPGRVEGVMVAEAVDDGFVFLPEMPGDARPPQSLGAPDDREEEYDEEAEADAFLDELTGPGPVPDDLSELVGPGPVPDDLSDLTDGEPLAASPEQPAPPSADSTAGSALESATPASPDEVADEALREVEFFLEQGLEEEALQTLGEALRLLPPGSPLRGRLEDLSSRLAARTAGDPASTPEPSAEVSVGDDETEEPQPAAAVPSVDEESGPQPVRPLMSAQDAETHYDLGIAYMEMGLFADAIHEFRTAMEADVRRAECHALIGRCYLRSHNPGEATVWLKRGLRVQGLTEPQRLGLMLSLGEAHLAVGDREEAREYLEKVRAATPEVPSLKKLLRQCGVNA